MRSIPSVLVVLTLVGATGTLSSSISAQPAPAENAPEGAVDETPSGVHADTAVRIHAAVDAEDYDEALGIVRRRLAQDPPRGEASSLHLVEARILRELGEVQGAAHVYRRLLDDEELGPKAREELHDLWVQRGEFSRADDLTEDVAEPSADADPHLLRLRAYSLAIQGRYAESARLMVEPALASDHEAQVLRANALLVLGDQDGAEQLFLEVLREAQDARVRQVAHFGLGQIARLRGARANRALQDERAAQLGPAPWAELDWGLALRALGRKDEARDRLEQVTERYPQIASTARLALGRLDEEEGDVEAGIEHLVASLDGSIGDFLALTRLGDLLIREGNDDDGIEVYRDALTLFPAFPPARERLTRTLASRGRWEEAPPELADDDEWEMPGWTWDRLLDGDLPYHRVAADRDELPPGDPRRVVLALVHLRAGFGAAALGWTEGVDPEAEPMLAVVRAEALAGVGRVDDARDLWERIGASSASPPFVEERLARLSWSESPERAREHWRSYFQRVPGDARAWIRRAELLEADDQYGEALGAYARALEGGWLSPVERRRARIAHEDLEDLLKEQEEIDIDADVEGRRL